MLLKIGTHKQQKLLLRMHITCLRRWRWSVSSAHGQGRLSPAALRNSSAQEHPVCAAIEAISVYDPTQPLLFETTHLVFCASFFPFFPPVHPTLHRQFSSAKPPLSGTSELLLFVEDREPAGAGSWRGVWAGSLATGKKTFKMAREKRRDIQDGRAA